MEQTNGSNTHFGVGSITVPIGFTCPSCGYCPHCGRSNGYPSWSYPTYPIYAHNDSG